MDEWGNWNDFLNKLDCNDEFDIRMKKYLKDIRYISEIPVEKIDLSDEREDINEHLKCIVKFINDYSENYYEIGLIKGFKTNEKLSNGVWKIDGRDYYYYIADQKMKASIYCVRYRNYIDNHMNSNEKAEQDLQNEISIIKEMIEPNIDVSFENVISSIDEFLDKTEETSKLRRACMNYIDQIRATDIEYIKYMLVNNMMREVRYIGAAYQYLWHWELKTKNLFRYVSYEGKEMAKETWDSKKFFLQEMFNRVIAHMTRSSEVLASYSEDPYIDIFKYLKIKKDQEESNKKISLTSKEIMLEMGSLENNNSAWFDIVKGIKINSIYSGNEPQSFYEFVQDNRDLNDGDTLAYAVELYPELPETEKNSKNTSKGIKTLLIEYLRTWMMDVDVKKLGKYVADDKEVVTYGKIEKNKVIVEQEQIPQRLVDGNRYHMQLSKNDLIYLLLKINESNTVEEIVEQINIEIEFGDIESWIEKVLKQEKQEKHNISGAIVQQIADNKKISIDFNCEVPASIVNQTEDSTLEKCRKKIRKNIKKIIKEYFKGKYNDILNSEHKIAEFILQFIKGENYICPSYITTYNQFEPEKSKDGMIEFDKEIAILKHIIFKGWYDAN